MKLEASDRDQTPFDVVHLCAVLLPPCEYIAIQLAAFEAKDCCAYSSKAGFQGRLSRYNKRTKTSSK
jgi:hypothetical protein